MRIKFGPPGHKGVTQIMGLGTDEAQVTTIREKVGQYLPDEAHQTVAGLSVGLGLVGFLLGSSRLQNLALGAGAAALLCAHLMKRESSGADIDLLDLPSVGSLH